MSIKDIRRYFELVREGPETAVERLEIFLAHRRHVLEEMDSLEKHLEKIDGKIRWYKENYHVEEVSKGIAVATGNASK